MILKYNTDGDKLWNRTYGTPLSDLCFNIVCDGLNHIYIVGYNETLSVDTSHNFEISCRRIIDMG